jgi:hypothetical protein
MIELGYRDTPDYPYDYRIELVEYDTEERKKLTTWLKELKIPHTTAGWNTGSVLFMRKNDAVTFALRWS